MKKWFVASVAVFAIACSSADSTTRKESEAGATSTNASALDSVAGTEPVRIDTLRTKNGEAFSPTSVTFAMTSAGNVIAINREDKQLVLFDTAGHQRRVAGRKGAGPGEFQYPNSIFVLPNDTIAVWDMSLRRISYFDDTLKFIRTEQFPLWNFTGMSQIVGRLGDGRWVAQLETREFNPDETSGAFFTVDTLKLVAGQSNAAPVDLVALRPQSGVDLTARTSATSSSTHALRLNSLSFGVGAVCERGVIVADTGGVKEYDFGGKITRSYRLPRVGDSIRTDDERREILDWQVGGIGGSDPNIGKARSLLLDLVKKYSTRYIQPYIDGDGRLWYGRYAESSANMVKRFQRTAPNMPRHVIDELDSAGTLGVSLSLASEDPKTQIGNRFIAMTQYGSDTTGLTVLLARAPKDLLANKNQRLGRCSPSFSY